MNEAHTHITREVVTSCADLGDASIASVLQHLQRLLTAVQSATHRLSKLMGRCEGAFEGVFLGDGGGQHGRAGGGGASGDAAMEVWNEQLALLDRSVNDGHSAA